MYTTNILFLFLNHNFLHTLSRCRKFILKFRPECEQVSVGQNLPVNCVTRYLITMFNVSCKKKKIMNL